MDRPSGTPLSPSVFSNAPPPPPPRSSSVAPILPFQHAVPAHKVQQPQPEHHPLQSYTNTHPTHIHYGTLSTEPLTAVATLQEIPIPTIFTLLKSYRSCLLGNQRFDSSQLPKQMCQALYVLAAYPDDSVLTWLTKTRSPVTLNSAQDLYGNYNLSSCRVAADDFAQSPSSIRIPPRTPWDQTSNIPYQDAYPGEQSSPAATSSQYNRWCFVCKNSLRPLTTLDGYKRHMREHYTRYYCIPQDALVYTDGRTKCKCGVFDPDAKHLSTHNVSKCIKKRYTRKENLIGHYEEKHGICDGSALADQSEYTVDQKYFACGFCLFCRGSLNELVNHVDAVHYRFSLKIDDWDDNQVIQSLLSEPVVNDCWRGVLAANSRLQASRLTWKPAQVKELIRRLEMRQEPADTLCEAAKAAIDQSSYGISQNDHVESVPFVGVRDMEMDISQPIQTFQTESLLPPLPYNLEQSSTANVTRMTESIPQSQSMERDSDGFNDSNWDTDYEDRLSLPITSEAYGSQAEPIYHYADHGAQPSSSLRSGVSFMHHQGPAYSSSITSASGHTRGLDGQAGTSHNTNFDGHTLDMSPKFATDSQSRQMVEMHTLPTCAHARRFHPTLTSQTVSSPLIRNYETSPLGHLDTAYSSRHHPTSVVQYPRQDTRECRGGDMNSGSGIQQRFVPGQGRSRREKHQR